MAAGEAALAIIKESTDPHYHKNILLFNLDLASFASITSFAQQVQQALGMGRPLDYLINNAGIMMCSEGQTEDGLELQFGANYLGPFLLTHLLLNKLKAAAKVNGHARIVNLSSISHNAGLMAFSNLNLVSGAYSPLRAYAQSKLATILWTRELARRLRENGNDHVTTYSVHPGIVKTDLYTNSDSKFAQLSKQIFGSIGFITPEQGAQTTLYCALEPSLENESGHYYKYVF